MNDKDKSEMEVYFSDISPADLYRHARQTGLVPAFFTHPPDADLPAHAGNIRRLLAYALTCNDAGLDMDMLCLLGGVVLAGTHKHRRPIMVGKVARALSDGYREFIGGDPALDTDRYQRLEHQFCDAFTGAGFARFLEAQAPSAGPPDEGQSNGNPPEKTN